MAYNPWNSSIRTFERFSSPEPSPSSQAAVTAIADTELAIKEAEELDTIQAGLLPEPQFPVQDSSPTEHIIPVRILIDIDVISKEEGNEEVPDVAPCVELVQVDQESKSDSERKLQIEELCTKISKPTILIGENWPEDLVSACPSPGAPGFHSIGSSPLILSSAPTPQEGVSPIQFTPSLSPVPESEKENISKYPGIWP